MMQQLASTSTAPSSLDLLALQASGATQGGRPTLVALALVHRLQVLCIQLFLTLLHVIRLDESTERAPTARRRRRDGASTPRRVRSAAPSIAEIEAKLLRDMTSPQLAVLRAPEPRRVRRCVPASRPPSPQLFAISEEE